MTFFIGVEFGQVSDVTAPAFYSGSSRGCLTSTTPDPLQVAHTPVPEHPGQTSSDRGFPVPPQRAQRPLPTNSPWLLASARPSQSRQIRGTTHGCIPRAA